MPRRTRAIGHVAPLGAAALVLASSAPAHAAGAFDTAFGGPGGARTALLGGAELGNRASCTMATPDGGLLIAGAATQPTTGAQGLGLLKVGPDGLPDGGFGDAGRVVLGVGEDAGHTTSGYGCDLALDAQGRYLAAGAAADASERYASTLVRLTAQGQLDAAFGGGDGAVVDQLGTGTGAESLSHSVVVLPGGDIVVGGSATTGPDTVDGVLVKYDSSGQRVAGFGAGGVARLQFSSGKGVKPNTRLARVAALPDGDLLVGGSTLQGSNQNPYSGVVARVRGDGSGLVGSWGDAGRRAFGATTGVQQLFVQQDGAVLLAGIRQVGGFVARLTPDGGFDPGYGSGGVVDLDQQSYAFGFAPRPGGGLLHARFSTSGDRVGIGALTATGQPDVAWAESAMLDLPDDAGATRQVMTMAADGHGGAFFAGNRHTTDPPTDRLLYGHVVDVAPAPPAPAPPPATEPTPPPAVPAGLDPPLGSPAARTPAAATPRLATTRVTLDRLGRAALRLVCPRASVCRGTVSLKRGDRRLARRRYALTAGRSTTIRLLLAKSERRGIARAGRAGRRLSAVLAPTTGRARSVRVVVRARR